jgi:hypothetical protein
MTSRLFITLLIVLGRTIVSDAQQVDTQLTLQAGVAVASPVGVIESVPLESVTSVPNAPFTADAETEFTQVLGDGNRIERHYSSTMARDSQGRTRREEEIALVGPLAVDGPSPRLVTILDGVTGHSYTLDERQRIAFRNPIVRTKVGEAHAFAYAYHADSKGTATWARESDGNFTWTAAAKPNVAITMTPGQRFVPGDAAASKVTTESLGTRSIEGVMAEGTRTTSTIPAGAIGNVMPIEVVSERWYSRELQMAVLITRKDPRSGDSVYRLHNIVRTEPPADLFTVPTDYEVRDGQLGSIRLLRKAGDKLEEEKVQRRPKE